MINIEIKNNIMDFDKLEKYRKYIINNKFRYLFYILTACLILLIIYYCIDAGIFVGFFGLIFLVILIYLYEYLCNRFIRTILQMKQRIYHIDEVKYDLCFKDDFIEIIYNESTTKLLYKNISNAIKISEGYLIITKYDDVILCDINNIDANERKEMVILIERLLNID